MSINQDRLKYLLGQYADKTATVEEVQEMFNLIKAANEGEDQAIKMWLNDTLAVTETDTNYDHKRWNKVLANILSPEPVVATPAKVKRMDLWKRVAAAACVALLFGAGWYFITNKPENPKPTEVAQIHDVKPPTNNKATITLANGQTVYLDSVNNGTLAQQGNVSLQKMGDGKIVYSGSYAEATVRYNTVSNPRGSRVIDMTLSDGTRFWLNAGSSVTYPVAFVGKERKVTMNGEAYFEVAHNAAMPFIVSKGDVEVTVLGTHFNVNAYDDENSIKVTLLEGSVKVLRLAQDDKAILKPGEQAIAMADTKLNPSTALRVTKDVDLKEVMAWKDGRFYFDGADIKTIMRQLSRWYDVDVDYQADVKYSFVAKISKDVPVSELLKILELTDLVHFKIEGKKVTVEK